MGSTRKELWNNGSLYLPITQSLSRKKLLKARFKTSRRSQFLMQHEAEMWDSLSKGC